MIVVDAHTHMVAPDEARYPRRADATPWVIAEPVSAEDLIQRMDETGVARALAVQALGVYGFDNAYVADAAEAHPDRLTGVCIVNPLEKDAPEQLRYWVEQRGMRGLRIFNGINAMNPDNAWLDDPVTFPTWERCRMLGISVAVATRFNNFPRLRRLLERFNDIPIALDHMGGAPFQDGPPYRSAQPLFDLAGYPNFHLKISPLNLREASMGKAAQQDVLQRLVEQFGPGRIIWGSNYPATYDPPYQDLTEMARSAFSFLADRERGLILGGNADRLWPAAKGRGNNS